MVEVLLTRIQSISSRLTGIVIAGFALVLLAPNPCEAQTVIYTQKAQFLASTGATSATGALPDLGINNQHAGPMTLGAVTYSLGPRGRDFIFSEWSNESPRERSYIAGNEMALGNVEDFDLGFAAPIHSMGFETSEPTDTVFPDLYVDSLFTVTLFNGATPVGAYTFSPANDAVSFIGVHSTQAFTRAEIRETQGGLLNEYFGEIYTGNSPILAEAVPEPGGLVLMLTGLMTLISVGAGRIRRG